MEIFIIYSQEYRMRYAQFKNYLRAIGYSEASCKTFDTGIKEFLHWLEKQQLTTIDQVREKHIEKFYSYQQERPSLTTGGALSESRVTLHMYTLKLFFQYLQDIEQIEINPMSNLNYTTDYKRTRENLLTQKDIEKLYEVCDTARQRAILGIFYGCGLRKQEAERLNAKDIHLRTAMLYVTEGKGNRKRTIPLSKKVLHDFRDYYINERPTQINYRSKDISAFILNKWGTRMSGESYNNEIKKLITKADIDKSITLHHFRHAIATHLIESGMKTEHVKDFLGHMSIETTQTYTHITTTEMKKTTAYEHATRLPA